MKRSKFSEAHIPKAPSEKGWMLSRDAAISADTVDAVDGEANAATPLPSFVEPVPPPTPPPPQAEASEEAVEGGVDEDG